MQVVVRDNNIDQALKALKKKLQREGVFRAFDAGEVAKMIRTLIDVASYSLRDNPAADLSAYAREARAFIQAAIYP